MFCKNTLLKPYMFRSLLYDHSQGPSFVLSASTTSPLVCFVQLLIRYVAVCCLCVCVCVCVPDVPVCGMSGRGRQSAVTMHCSLVHSDISNSLYIEFQTLRRIQEIIFTVCSDT
jgi:hypothetical protein